MWGRRGRDLRGLAPAPRSRGRGVLPPLLAQAALPPVDEKASPPGRFLRRIGEAEPRTLKRVLGCFVFLFLGTLITHGHWAGSGDPVHYMMATRSLVSDGDFDLADDYADPANPIFGGRLEPGLHAMRGRNGALYPVHDVGLPVLAAPWFAVASFAAETAAARLPSGVLARAHLDRWILLRQLLSFGMIVVACLLAVLMFDACLDAGATRRLALSLAALWTLSPPVLGVAFAFFTEVPTALGALWLFLQARRPWTGGRVRGAALGFAAGFLLLIHARDFALAFSLLALLVRGASRRARPALGAGFAAAAGIRTWVTWHFWGTLMETPHASFAAVPPGRALAETGSRLLAACFDAEHGLLASAPLYLMVIAGLVLLRRSAPGLFRDLSWVALPYLLSVMLPVINRHGWRGGWSPAARFLVPISPFLALAVLQALKSCRPWVPGVLVALQCALDGLFWSRPKLLWEDGDGRSALLEAVAGDRLARWWPSWTWPTATLAAACAVALAAWIAVTALLLRGARAPGTAGQG